jgi:hypothetical protein
MTDPCNTYLFNIDVSIRAMKAKSGRPAWLVPFWAAGHPEIEKKSMGSGVTGNAGNCNYFLPAPLGR